MTSRKAHAILITAFVVVGIALVVKPVAFFAGVMIAILGFLVIGLYMILHDVLTGRMAQKKDNENG